MHNPDTLAALIRGALLAPTNDLPRMILADFLDEHTDMDSTILRKPSGVWYVRTLFQDVGHHNTAVTYRVGYWNRWFSRNHFQITIRTDCRCRNPQALIWHPATPPVDENRFGPPHWTCSQCGRSRHRPTVQAIKKATFGGIVLGATG